MCFICTLGPGEEPVKKEPVKKEPVKKKSVTQQK
jgi:hypothetical protein